MSGRNPGAGGVDGSGGASATGGGNGTGGARATGGATGSGGGSGKIACAGERWSSDGDYVPGDVVSYDGGWYVCVNANAGLDPVVSDWFWDVHDCDDGGGPGTGGQGSTVDGCVLDELLPNKKGTWREMFRAPWANPEQHEVYDDGYNKLCEALEHPQCRGFASSGTDEQNKRELAAFLANVAIETAYLQESAEGGNYSSNSHSVGRGAIQLTHNFNYQAAASALGKPSIESDPRSAATDPLVVWETACWFWMKKRNESVASPNICHPAILGGDFGRTLRIIKGDCGSLASRQEAYRKATDLIGVSEGDLSCP